MNFLICSTALAAITASQAVGQVDVAWGQPADAHLVAPPGIDVAPAGWGPSVNGLQVSLVMSPTAIQPGQPLIYLQLHVKNTSDRDVRVLNWDQQLTSLVVQDAAGKVMPATDDERGAGPKDWDFPTIPAGQSRVFQQMQGWSGRVEKEALVFSTPHSMRTWQLAAGDYTVSAAFAATPSKTGATVPADAAPAVSQPVKFTLLDKMLPQPANRVIVGLSAPTRTFRVGEAVMLRLHVKNTNDEIRVASGLIELYPESGEYHLMRTSANAVRQDKVDDGAVPVWELVIPADARIDVWPRHSTSSKMSPPITGLPAGVYRVRWFGHHTPMGSKYRTGDVDIIVK